MNRRSFFRAAPAAAIAAVVAPFVAESCADKPASGVGVLRFPNKKGAQETAKRLMDQMRPGCVLALPNTRDDHGAYCWDFRIEGGDPGQVKVERLEGA